MGSRSNYCAVFNCLSKSKTEKHLRFFSFPKEVERCNLWKEAVGRGDLMFKTAKELHRSHRVCSIHFNPNLMMKKKLKSHAIPTMFLPNSGEEILSVDIKPDLVYEDDHQAGQSPIITVHLSSDLICPDESQAKRSSIPKSTKSTQTPMRLHSLAKIRKISKELQAERRKRRIAEKLLSEKDEDDIETCLKITDRMLSPKLAQLARRQILLKLMQYKKDNSAITMDKKTSLGYIAVSSNNPFELFKTWMNEASHYIERADILTFATTSKDGYVTNRSLLMRKVEEDGFLMMSDRRSLKSAQIKENNQCASVFQWCYKKDNNLISHQVRFEGTVEEISREKCYNELYAPEPFYCKVRSHFCHQGIEVDWDELTEKHGQTAEMSESTINTMPDHVVGYKVIPNRVEFYSSENDHQIADRIQFNKKSGEGWSYIHIAA